MRPLKVCIIGLKCFDHIAQNPLPRYVGGIETQLVVLARGLVQQGCEVSLVTYDHGQADEMHVDGVRVIKSYKPETGFPVLRNFHPRSTGVWRGMRRADADVYLQMGAGLETGQVGLGCSLVGGRRRQFIFCLASDSDVGFEESGWEGKAYQRGVLRADRIVAQTKAQRAGIQRALGLEAEVVPMAVFPPAASEGRRMSTRDSSAVHILWIGRIIPGKRFEWLLETARRCPEFHFDIAGAPNRDSSYASALLEDASRIANVTVHGRVSGEELSTLYKKGRLLCCTSELEGFPTTFLEAWSCGMPVVTTFDPDHVVAQHEIGRVAANLDGIISHLRDLIADPPGYDQISRAATDYFEQNHTVESVSRRFRLLLEER
ncbi:MAG: glycosyltransferase family 4 protein [Bryobacteraceae bacterium]